MSEHNCTSYFYCFYMFLMLSKLRIYRSTMDYSHDIRKWSNILRYFQDLDNTYFRVEDGKNKL